MNTGINKIKEPDFIFNEFFTVIFKRLRLNEEINEGVNELYLTIIKNPGLRVPALSE
ncbi:MAG: hypothetical protein WC401_11395 [Bacteroidales bacterium]|jgi:hypothetical protein